MQEGNTSYSRMHANSKSMSVLSDDYGSYQRSKDANSRQNSRDAANTNFQRSGPHSSMFFPTLLGILSRGMNGETPGVQVGVQKPERKLEGKDETKIPVRASIDIRESCKAANLATLLFS